MAEEVALVPIKNSLADLDELEMFEMQQENSSHEIISKIRSIRSEERRVGKECLE